MAKTLWRTNLYWLVCIQILAGSAILGLISFVPLFIHELGVHDVGQASMWAGLVTAVTSLTAAVANPYWGAYGDRHGHKSVLLIILGSLTLIMAAMAWVQSPFSLFLLRALQGCAGGFIAAGMAMVVVETPREHATYALGIYQTGIVLGGTLGPLIGGAAADILGYRNTFLVFAAFALAALLCTALFVKPQAAPRPQTPKEPMWDNFKLFLSIPLVRAMMIVQFLVQFGLTGIGPIIPLYLKGMTADEAALATISGTIIAIGGIASAVSSFNAGRVVQWLSHRRILIYGAILAGTCFILQYAAPNVWIFALFRGLTGFFIGMLMPSVNTLIAENVPSEKRGIAFGVTSGTALMGNVAGPFVSGALAVTLGMSAVFWSTACMFFAVALLVRRSLTDSAA